MQLIKLLLEHLLIILTHLYHALFNNFLRQKIEAVDAKGLNIVSILEDDLANALHRVVPLAILDMDLAFLGQHWLEIRVEHGDL